MDTSVHPAADLMPGENSIHGPLLCGHPSTIYRTPRCSWVKDAQGTLLMADKYEWKRPVIDWAAKLKKVRDYRKDHGTNWDIPLVAEAGCGSLDDLVHFSHPTFMIARLDSICGGNLLASLFHNTQGHTNLLLVHNPGVATAIPAVMSNEVTIKDKEQIPLLFGSAQKGASIAIDACILLGILPNDQAVRNQLVIGVEVYLDKAATDFERVQDNIMVAVVDAIVIAVTGGTSVEDATAACPTKHVFADVAPSPAFPNIEELTKAGLLL